MLVSPQGDLKESRIEGKSNYVYPNWQLGNRQDEWLSFLYKFLKIKNIRIKMKYYKISANISHYRIRRKHKTGKNKKGKTLNRKKICFERTTNYKLLNDLF